MIYSLGILNPSFETVAILFDFISCIWTTQYYGTGEFELVLPYTEENWDNLAVGNYVVKNNKTEVAVIERKNYSFSANEGGTITVSGRLGISLLDRRLLYAFNPSTHKPQTRTYCSANQKVEEAARLMVDANMIASLQTDRNYSGLHLGTLHGFTETAGWHYSTYLNMYNALTALLASKGMAHRVLYQQGTGLVYDVYKGTNRSSSMVFSRNLGNLLSFTYERDETDYKNYFYVAGDGDGLDRFVTDTTVNHYTAGNNRRESVYEASSNREEDMTASAYNQVLKNEAQQNGRELNVKTEVTAEIDLVNSGYEFGVDYFVGDIILINDIIGFAPRITTVIESQSADGYTIDVEFNEDAPEEEEE